MPDDVRYKETECRSALNRVHGMGFKWSLNPYRGCVHGCHYCFARRYNSYADLDPGNDFSGLVFVKTNVVDVLKEELSLHSWVSETVAMGTATDPYQPIEGKYRLTRGCLEALAERHTPVRIVTKGTMALRDVDVLADMASRAGASVCFSITTLDHDLWKELEPGTPPPLQRLHVMEQLAKAGVSAGVLLAPIGPGMTDDQQSLRAVVEAAAAHGASFLGTQVLHLQAGTKEHFMSYLETQHPRLYHAYQQLYPAEFAPKQFQQDIRERVAELKDAYGLREREHNDMGLAVRERQLELVGV